MTGSCLRCLAPVVVMLLVLAGPARADLFDSNSKTYQTTYFRVHYDKEETTAAYAKKIGDWLEIARNKILNDFNYKAEEWLEDYRLDVYVKNLPPDDGGFDALGYAHRNTASPGERLVHERFLRRPYIEIDLEENLYNPGSPAAYKEHKLKSLIAHEFFHIVQFGYDDKERYWLMEATAVWAEDKVFPTPEDLWLLTGYRNWVERWDNNRRHLGLVNSTQLNKYAASFFFQYLTERRPGRIDVVRRIWEEAAKTEGPGTYAALAAALGDSSPWGPRTKARIGEFAAAAFMRSPDHHRTYSFAKLADVKEDFDHLWYPVFENDEEDRMPGVAFEQLTGTRVRTKTRRLKTTQIGYFELLPPEQALASERHVREQRNLGKLVIEIRGKQHQDWDFRLIEFPRYNQQNTGWTIRKFPPSASRGNWSRLEIDNFPKRRVALSVVNLKPLEEDKENPTLPASSFEYAAAFLTPPVVTQLKIDQEDKNGQWRTVWKMEREPSARAGRWRTRNLVSTGISYDETQDESVRVHMTFNRGVHENPSLTVGGVNIVMERDWRELPEHQFAGSIGFRYSRFFKGELCVKELGEYIARLKAGEKLVRLPVSIEAFDSWGSGLDKDPGTEPYLSGDGEGTFTIERWEGDAGRLGNKDTLGTNQIPFHMLKPPAYLTDLTILQDGRLIYDARWETNPDRTTRRKLKVLENKAYNPDKLLQASFSFSEPVKEVVVRLSSQKSRYYPEGHRVHVPSAFPDDLYNVTFNVSIPGGLAAVKDVLRHDTSLIFEVAAQNENEIPLDADPRTAAWYDRLGDRWYALEETKDYTGENRGGPDRWHNLNTSGHSYVLVLDASGSMAWGNRMAYAKAGIGSAVRDLRKGDEVALIVFYHCDNIQLVVPFTEKPDDLLKALPGINPSAGTPLGDAIVFAKAYMKRAAKYQDRKLLTFSDGITTCGSAPATVVSRQKETQPEEEPQKEAEKPQEIQWTAYRVEADRERYVPNYHVVEFEYYQRNTSDEASARFTVRNYPVSWMESRGRTVWSINWSSPRQRSQKTAVGKEDVAALRAEAEALRSNAMEKGRVHAAVQRAIGPGAVPLSRSR